VPCWLNDAKSNVSPVDDGAIVTLSQSPSWLPATDSGSASEYKLHDARRIRGQQGPAHSIGADERERPSGALAAVSGQGRRGAGFQRRSRPGEPIVDADLSRRFVSACKRAGLPRLCFHELRHTFGTQAIRTFKIHDVQRMLGHRHVTTTEKYLHYAPDSEASAKLTELWGDRGDPGRSTLPPAVLPENVVPLRRAA
jgi:hypothetical protein